MVLPVFKAIFYGLFNKAKMLCRIHRCLVLTSRMVLLLNLLINSPVLMSTGQSVAIHAIYSAGIHTGKPVLFCNVIKLLFIAFRFRVAWHGAPVACACVV